MDIDAWMNNLIEQLMIEFKERLGASNAKTATSISWSL